MSEYRSIPEMFFAAAARGGSSARYLSKRDGRYGATSWEECRRNVEEIAAGLLGLGLAPEDRVAILSSTRPEWTESDLAALALGCITIPIYPSNLPEECAYILADSGARTVFVENAEQARKVADHVDHLVVFDGAFDGATGLDELRAAGRAVLDSRRGEIEQRTRAIEADRLATIVYTSGTTGMPKGVMQSHGNHLAAIAAVGGAGIVKPGDIDFSFLPLAHSFGRMMEYLGLYLGTITAYAEKIETISDDLVATRPHFMPAVPRIFEKIYGGVQQAREEGGALRRLVFDWAVAVGRRRAAYVNRGRAVPAPLGVVDALAHRLVFARIHARVGGRMRFLISGGAPLAPQINAFFHAVGLPVLEGYGLTETTPILTCNVPGETRIGTVGKAVEGVTLELAADGEILAKGPNIAHGYYRLPEETSEAWDREGWFHTGDIGELDDGYLRITDRKKELIKTAGGKYVAPQKIENMLKSRRLISQAVVVGDRLRYCVALITVDPDAAAGMDGERIEDAVAKEVDEVNRGLASYETIKYFRLLPSEFSIEAGELTPSLKIKRKVIADKYADVIAEMV